MRKILALVLAVALALCASSCESNSSDDAFSVTVICESDGIYQIFYSCYLDDKYYAMGGMADFDGGELSSDSELNLMFTKSYFDGRDDIPSFSIDFSPYGKDDTSEIGTTNRVDIPAEYGKSYTVVFSGDRDIGFKAELAA